MDNLTHSLTGVYLSRAGFNRLAPDAGWILFLSANAPDADMVSALAGPAASLHWHRSFTHGFVFSPLLALLCVLAVRLVSRRNERWLSAFLIAWAGVLSHIGLDLTNNYGVRILSPFSGEWFHWDIAFVLDPWIWSVLLLALFAPWLARVVSSEIGQRKLRFPPRGWPIAALLFLLLYYSGRAVLHARAIATLESRDYSGTPPIRAAAFPTPFSPLKWDALVELPGRYSLYILNLNEPFNPDDGRVLFKNSPGRAVPALAQLPSFAALIEFSQFPIWRVHEDSNNSMYSLTDLRFGDPLRGTFTCSARLMSRSAAGEQCDFTFAPLFEAP